MGRAGHDPEALADYVARTEGDSGETVCSALPTREKRIAVLAQVIGELGEPTYSSGDECRCV